MQQIEFFVDNIKCGGCANTVTKKLNAYEGVTDVAVNVEEGRVSFSAPDNLSVEEV
ncbi:MAG: heavy-metal-associated domain-containing protein, partial [Bacteroidetes bacterium]|nr:heavy-metal-associated domain-containing protein [Bacteroidota bacterium]